MSREFILIRFQKFAYIFNFLYINILEWATLEVHNMFIFSHFSSFLKVDVVYITIYDMVILSYSSIFNSFHAIVLFSYP